MRTIFVLLFLTIPACGQFLDVRNVNCECPLSRGSQAYIVGDWHEIPEGAPVFADSKNPLPREMAGYAIEINGVRQGISEITRHEVYFVVSTAIPTSPSRPKPRPYLITLITPHGRATWYFWMTDSSPWLFEADGNVTGTYRFPEDPVIRVLSDGVIDLMPDKPAIVSLNITGALSFYAAPEYYIYVILSDGSTIEIPAQVTADPNDEGRQLVTFIIQPSLYKFGQTHVLFRSPSNFSQLSQVWLGPKE